MFRIAIILFTSALLLSSCGIEVDVYQRAKDVRAKELDAGRCSDLVMKKKKKRNSPSGYILQTEFFRIQESTDSIEAKLNAQFGIEFMLISNRQQWVPIKIEWLFPNEIENQYGKKFKKFVFKNSIITRERTFHTIKLSHKNMVKKGKWTLRIYHKKNILLEKFFFLY